MPGNIPTVSVIIPNYNHARFLDQRLSSVLQQTYQNFEVIILDDMSTDNSREIIEKYRDHPKVKTIIYSEVNSGRPILQWLKGIELANTDWIWIAESDDYCEPGFLESLSPVFSDENIGLALSDVSFVDEQSKIIKTFPTTSTGIHEGSAFISEKMLEDCFVCNSGMAVFRKNAAPISGDWIKQFSFSPDYYFWTAVMQQGHVYTCGKRLAYFRKHDAEFTHGKLESVASQKDHAHLLGLLNKKGSLEKDRLTQLVTDKLVSLYTRQKGMQRALFEALTGIWFEFAAVSGLSVSNTTVQAKAILRKIKHRFRTLYAIG